VSGVTLPPDATGEAALDAISCSPASNCDAVGGYRSTSIGGRGRPMALALGEPPPTPAVPPQAPTVTQNASDVASARPAPLAVIATGQVAGTILRLLAPSGCNAPTARTSLRLTSQAARNSNGSSYRVERVAVYIDGGRRATVLAGSARHRHRRVIYRPQFQSGGAAQFSFVPAQIRAHTGRNSVLAVVTLVRYRVVGHRRVAQRKTTRLKSTLLVC
jgi:hypothetical protein